MATNEQPRRLIGHSPPELGIRQRNSLFHGCRYRVVAYAALQRVVRANDIGPTIIVNTRPIDDIPDFSRRAFGSEQ
jgi:hypothetical protein